MGVCITPVTTLPKTEYTKDTKRITKIDYKCYLILMRLKKCVLCDLATTPFSGELIESEDTVVHSSCMISMSSRNPTSCKKCWGLITPYNPGLHDIHFGCLKQEKNRVRFLLLTISCHEREYYLHL